MNAVFVGEDPSVKVMLLYVVQWSLEAWKSVTNITINNCWVALRLLGNPFGPVRRLKDWDESREALRAVIRQAAIREALSLTAILTGNDEALDSFISLADEAVYDEEDELLEIIARGFTEVYADDEDDDIQGLLLLQITVLQASDAINTLIRYEE
ncbi:CENP-B protein 2 [Fusarium austroafricanum]|uniref:CENP-B protein 2 n=1 Tax=Fusarium austroafricanum TaxID=2364996 RepID=A0A8H4JGV2_9HYPO|nr:CENP-B protein 2 [Fusarium austroafricanum]